MPWEAAGSPSLGSGSLKNKKAWETRLVSAFLNIWSSDVPGMYSILLFASQKLTGCFWLPGQMEWLNRKRFIGQIRWYADYSCCAVPMTGNTTCRECSVMVVARGTLGFRGAMIFNECTWFLQLVAAIVHDSLQFLKGLIFLEQYYWTVFTLHQQTTSIWVYHQLVMTKGTKGMLALPRPFECQIKSHKPRLVQIFETIYWNFINKMLEPAVIIWLPVPEVPASEGYLVS